MDSSLCPWAFEPAAKNGRPSHQLSGPRMKPVAVPPGSPNRRLAVTDSILIPNSGYPLTIPAS